MVELPYIPEVDQDLSTPINSEDYKIFENLKKITIYIYIIIIKLKCHFNIPSCQIV